ncbi:putative polysaccharide biosynthesis protein [Terrilactibacillus laevilacticus]|uniref:Oligosaccharide flippase family protein n=1 Tax=Terrilactibacillus laevilacticus TaxID=1380157 RepID=A0ABW5PTA0_9BACI|nr:polysaccharide biosynthesis protein [Terrilactibacillus laevilacticus]
MIRGTLILTVATFLSKMLGIVFVIPFTALVGNDGVFLYSIAYIPYSIILSISTLGLPLAVSKFVAKYNAMGDYHTGKRLFKSGLLMMSLSGLIGFLFLFIFAPKITGLIDAEGHNLNDMVLVIRVVSISILIVPSMSLIRGYFQGYQSMGPTAVSQVIEQIVRIAFILLGSFLVIKVFHGSVRTASAMATFAAFVGAVAGLYVMLLYWMKRRHRFNEMDDHSLSSPNMSLSLSKMYKELLSYAISFVAVGIAMQVYQLIDQYTIFRFLHYSTRTMTTYYAALSMNDQKIIMIPVSLATALAVSVVPSMITSYAEGDQRSLHKKITQALQFVLFLTLPAAAGLSILGYMIHGLFYTVDPRDLMIGGHVLRWYAPTALFFALFSVTASILQGINRQRVTLYSLLVGVLFKLILNPICMILFGMVGPIIATNIGYCASILINLYAIKRQTGYNYTFIAKRTLLISIFTFAMLILIKLIFMLTGGHIPNTRGKAIVISVISIGVGGCFYLLVSMKTGLLRQVIGKVRVPILSKLVKKHA